jgi:uncharacterized protein (DUF58 family)
MDYFNQFQLRELNNLELLAKQVVEGFIIGLHKSPFHGFSVEFAEHRLFNQGESTRNIDWKVFARTDKMFSKRYEEETNLRCQIVVDASSSMYFPKVDKDSKEYINKIRFSALAAASLMNLLRKQRDAYGISIFNDEVVQHSPCKSSISHYRLMLTYLHDYMNLYDPAKRTGTKVADSLHQIADSIHKRSLVIIFSDMFEGGDTQELFPALQHLRHNKHEVILFHTVDKSKEVDFQFDNRPYVFVDMESGDQVRLRPKQVREMYRKQIGSVLEELRMKCLQYRIDLVEADIHEGFYPILQSYLVKRSKMRI